MSGSSYSQEVMSSVAGEARRQVYSEDRVTKTFSDTSHNSLSKYMLYSFKALENLCLAVNLLLPT